MTGESPAWPGCWGSPRPMPTGTLGAPLPLLCCTPRVLWVSPLVPGSGCLDHSGRQALLDLEEAIRVLSSRPEHQGCGPPAGCEAQGVWLVGSWPAGTTCPVSQLASAAATPDLSSCPACPSPPLFPRSASRNKQACVLA